MRLLKLWGIALAFSISVWGCSNEDILQILGEIPSEKPLAQEEGEPAAAKGEGWLYGYLLDASNPPAHASLTGPVTISVGDTTYSAEQSSFFLIKLPAGKAHLLRIETPGYAQTSQTVHVEANTSRFVNFSLLPFLASQTFDAGEDIELSVNGASVFFPANALNAQGQVTVSLAHLDADNRDALRAFPGGFLTDTGELLESFGALAIEVRDGNGALVNLKDGAFASITIPASANTAEDSIPLWSYDEVAGVWKEEGVLEGCLSGFCTGEIPHLSWWNCDIAMDVTCLRACAVDTNGNPAANIYFEVTGVDYNSVYSSSPPAYGCDCLPVRINSRVRVVAVSPGGIAHSDEISTGNTQLTCESSDCTTLPEPLVVAAPPFQAVLTWEEWNYWSYWNYFSSRLTGPCPYASADCPENTFSVGGHNWGSLFAPPFASFSSGYAYVGPEAISLSACSEGTYQYSVHNCARDASVQDTAKVVLLLPDGSPLTVSAASSSSWSSWVVGELRCPSADCQECTWVPINTFELDDDDDDDNICPDLVYPVVEAVDRR